MHSNQVSDSSYCNEVWIWKLVRLDFQSNASMTPFRADIDAYNWEAVTSGIAKWRFGQLDDSGKACQGQTTSRPLSPIVLTVLLFRFRVFYFNETTLSIELKLKSLPGMGGAMDLVFSYIAGTRVIITMEHNSKSGEPKILKSCTLPVTGKQCVDLIITEKAVFKVKDGLTLLEIANDCSLEELRKCTECEFKVSPDLKPMQQIVWLSSGSVIFQSSDTNHCHRHELRQPSLTFVRKFCWFI